MCEWLVLHVFNVRQHRNVLILLCSIASRNQNSLRLQNEKVACKVMGCHVQQGILRCQQQVSCVMSCGSRWWTAVGYLRDIFLTYFYPFIDFYISALLTFSAVYKSLIFSDLCPQILGSTQF